MTDTWTWATVTQASPLRIKVDGDTTALDATTDNLVGSLAVLDRVRVHLHADGIIVTGIQGGGTPEATAATANTLALRDGDGQLKAADGVADDDVATVGQLSAGDEDALLLEMSSNVVEYSGGLAPRLYRKGEVVMISGGIKPANSGAASDFNGYSPTNICKIPASLQPRFRYAMHSIQQGSGKDRWHLSFSGDWLCGSRYGPGTPSTSTWFPFSITYII